MAHSVLTNAAVASGGRVLTALLGFVATGLLTRSLGADTYGQYTVLIVFGTLVQLVADWGLYLTLTREIARYPTQASTLVATITSLRLVLLMGAFSVGWLLSFSIRTLAGLQSVLLLVAVGLVVQSLSQLLMGVFAYQRTIWKASVGDMVGRLVQIAGIVVGAVAAPGLLSMAVAFTLGTVAAYVLHWWLTPAAIRPGWRLEVPAWGQMLRVSWPLGAMLVLNAIYFRVDALILSYWRSAAEVGYYGLAYRVIESSLFFPAMFGGLLLPRLSESWQRGERQRVAMWLEEGLGVLLVGAAIVMVLMVILAEPLTVLVAGEEFRAAAPYLQVLSIALAVMFLGNLFGFTLVALERQRVLLKLYFGLAIVNTAANLVVIPRWGAWGAAWITVGTELVAASVAGMVVWYLTHYSVSRWWLLRLTVLVVVVAGLAKLLPATVPVLVEGALLLVFSGALVVWLRVLPLGRLRLLLAT